MLNGKVQEMEQGEEFDLEEEGDETAADWHHNVEAVEKIDDDARARSPH